MLKSQNSCTVNWPNHTFILKLYKESKSGNYSLEDAERPETSITEQNVTDARRTFNEDDPPYTLGIRVLVTRF